MTAGWYDSHANQPNAARHENGQLRAQHQTTLHQLATARAALTFVADIARATGNQPLLDTAERALRASNPAPKEDML